MKVSHPTNVLKAKVPDLSAPPAKEEKRPLEKWGLFVIWANNQFVIKLSPQEEGGESQHGGNVPHPDVTYVHTPGLRKCESCPVWFFKGTWDFMAIILMTRTTNLSRVSSSRCVRSQAMYSRAASVILGHQDTSRLTCVYILSPNTQCLNQNSISGIVFCIFIQRTNQLSEVLCDQLDAVVGDLRTAGEGEDGQVRERVY